MSLKNETRHNPSNCTRCVDGIAECKRICNCNLKLPWCHKSMQREQDLYPIVFLYGLPKFVSQHTLQKCIASLWYTKGTKRSKNSTDVVMRTTHSEIQTYNSHLQDSSAPFSATPCLKKCAEDKNFTEELLKYCTMMSVLLLSGTSTQEEIHLQQVSAMFQTSGFTLRTWTFHNSTFLDAIPEEFRETHLLSLCKDGVTTIGLPWNPKTYQFQVKNSITQTHTHVQQIYLQVQNVKYIYFLSPWSTKTSCQL